MICGQASKSKERHRSRADPATILRPSRPKSRKTAFLDEADGDRTRNLRIDSPML